MKPKKLSLACIQNSCAEKTVYFGGGVEVMGEEAGTKRDFCIERALPVS